MAKIQILEFKHDGNTIRVFTGESSADVYYSINGGSSHSAGLRWNDEKGNFKSGSGSIVDFDSGKSLIRAKVAS